MRLFVDSRDVASHEVTYWPLGFGSAPTDVVPLQLRFEFDRDEFVDLLEPAYVECIAELRNDDVVTGDFNPPFPGAGDYPPLEEFMAKDARLFEEFFLDYLKLDILSECLVEGQERVGAAGRYVAYNISGVRLKREAVVLSGSCFERG